jgi:hypothetical protein
MEPDDLEIFASLRSNQINPFNRPNILDISGGGITTTPSAAMFLDDAGLPPIDTSFGVANEPDDEEDIERAKKISNRRNIGLGLLSLINPIGALIGKGFLGAQNIGGNILGGILNLNQRLRNTDFGRSKTLADYFDAKSYGGFDAREKARAETMAQARGIQKSIDRGDFGGPNISIDRGRGDIGGSGRGGSRSSGGYGGGRERGRGDRF